MRICFLSSMHPPLDKRVFDKEAITLARAGFEVIHLAPGESAGGFRQDNVELITYRRPRGIRGRLLQLFSLYSLAVKVGADCYHCNEVDSWFVGVAIKLLRGKKIVFDVHEHYPSTFAESRFPKVLRPLVAGAVRLGFRLLTPLTDRLVYAKRTVAGDFPGAASKEVLVQNYTPITNHQLSSTAAENAQEKGVVTAIHLGLIGRARGWPQLLEAVARMQSQNLRLRFVGTFNDNSRPEFDRTIRELGLSERITVEEWLPFEQAFRRLEASDIGLVLFQPGIQNHVFALPHKMFDYMLAELPLVAPAFAVEVAEIVKESDCGLLVNPEDPGDIARALDHLVCDASERRRLGANGRRAVFDKYNWETEAKKLVAMYSEMAGATK